MEIRTDAPFRTVGFLENSIEVNCVFQGKIMYTLMAMVILHRSHQTELTNTPIFAIPVFFLITMLIDHNDRNVIWSFFAVNKLRVNT